VVILTKSTKGKTMKKITKNSRTKTINGVIGNINSILSTMDQYKNCYFWKGDFGNATNRARREFKEEHSFEIFGDVVEVTLEFTMSRQNAYFTKDIYVNGNKSNATKLKGYIKKLDKILDARN